jgi:fructose 1,6-bisphosphate aldolase/phosphatase
MLDAVAERVRGSGEAIDLTMTFTGDDLCVTMTHRRGVDNPVIHNMLWDAFMDAAKIAEEQGLYGAGQDLLVDAPSGNIRGAGPGICEIALPDHNPVKENKVRPRETIMVFTADKCAPGALALPLALAFMDPMFNGGLLAKTEHRAGFVYRIIDTSQGGASDSVIDLNIPEDYWDVWTLLRDPDRFAIKAIYSRFKEGDQIAAVTVSRLHNIAGAYTGKDDPAAIVRTQGIFPAPELVLPPWKIAHYVSGDAMGLHVRAMMPVAINTPVVGDHCQPIAACVGYSIDARGKFSHSQIDFFGGSAWDDTRSKALLKSALLSEQGFHGNAIASAPEQAYVGGLVGAEKALLSRFRNEEPVATAAS